MNIPVLIANAIVLTAFAIHIYAGDKEFKHIEPDQSNEPRLQTWVMGRGAFHLVSADFLLACIGLTLVNFTSYFSDERLILNIIAVYFFAYGLAFLITLMISKKFPNSFFKLWQWLVMFLISGLIYFGANY